MDWQSIIAEFEVYCEYEDVSFPYDSEVTELWEEFLREQQGIKWVPKFRPPRQVIRSVMTKCYGIWGPQEAARELPEIEDEKRDILLAGPKAFGSEIAEDLLDNPTAHSWSDLYMQTWDSVLNLYCEYDEDLGGEVFLSTMRDELYFVRKDITDPESAFYLQY